LIEEHGARIGPRDPKSRSRPTGNNKALTITCPQQPARVERRVVLVATAAGERIEYEGESQDATRSQVRFKGKGLEKDIVS
jgi:hypothetical protein